MSLVDRKWYRGDLHPDGAAARRGHHQGARRVVGRFGRLGRHRSRARLVLGTADGNWVSMAVPSDGSYGIKEGVVYSYPVTCANGDYKIVQGLAVDEFSRASAWTPPTRNCAKSATASAS